MTITTGLSGNEIYCLNLKGYSPGDIVVGNSVYSLGLLRSISTGFKTLLGGELRHVTELIEEGRETAYKRMLQEAMQANADGITGVTSQLILHTGNVEFLSIGSMVFGGKGNKTQFSTAAGGQDLFAQLDAGYKPICFAFGNVAYSMGLGRGLLGGLKTFMRGEIKEFSDLFNNTRHLALGRLLACGKKAGANAVCGIQTTILPFFGTNEMLMIGTASHNPDVNNLLSLDIVSSDLTNLEMWNLAKLGYAPMRLLLGTSIYSLGFVGGVSAILKSFVRGEITELTKMIYDARENALDLINREAKTIGADDIVGVKTYVYQLGNGLIEFLAIGTAVKKISGIKTESEQLPPQAVMVERDTFYSSGVNVNTAKPLTNSNPLGWFIIIIVIFLGILSGIAKHS